RVPTGSRDEIGQLASEFNTMAEALSARDRELARQREELLRAARLATIGKMAAQITHEVRNPLSSIGLNAEMLEEEIGDSVEAQQLLTSVQREVHRLKAITEEYLRFARFPKPVLAPVDVSVIVDSFLSFLAHELRNNEITLRRPDTHQPLPVVMADEDQLRQAFLNVARNAIEALREVAVPRHFGVALAGSDAGGVSVIFTDDGPGLAEEIAPRVLDPFVTGKPGGTGLGLALVQQIVVDHGGTIEFATNADVCSTSARPGTRLLITLPPSGLPQSVVEVGQ
ncbi:MAG: ATP-binding protein, partial [Myxococcota bacterium]|nr:ATP-binding protein [Myxococcota bacterium]